MFLFCDISRMFSSLERDPFVKENNKMTKENAHKGKRSYSFIYEQFCFPVENNSESEIES